MKKNKTMRFAAMLLALTLVTSCFVGGTFAKYVTTQNGSDSARVAAFGVTINPNGELFNATYKTDATGTTFTGENSVVGTSSADVVAPGTSGTLTAMTISGTPEVAVEVKYVAELSLANWAIANDAYYCPIEIKVGDTTYKGSDYQNMAAFESAVEAAIGNYTAQYAPGQDLSGTTVSVPSVSWCWAIGEGNESDTYLGDVAANKYEGKSAATIELKITTTVTQID